MPISVSVHSQLPVTDLSVLLSMAFLKSGVLRGLAAAGDCVTLPVTCAGSGSGGGMGLFFNLCIAHSICSHRKCQWYLHIISIVS